MDKTNLTKREYLGKWNYHHFVNKNTGEEKFVECDNETLLKMNGIGGSEYNPQNFDGFEWVGTVGNSDKLDAVNGVFSENDYIFRDNQYVVCYRNNFGNLTVKEFTEEEFNNIWQ